MEVQYILGILHNLDLAIWAVLIFIAFVLVTQAHYKAQLAKLPTFETDKGNEKWRRTCSDSARMLYQEGHKKVGSYLVRFSKICPDNVTVQRPSLDHANFRWLNPIIYREVENALEDEIPQCEDWTPVFIYRKLLNTVAKVSGRIFVGAELSHNKDYLDTAINYTIELGNAVQAVKQMKPWLRPFLAWKLPEVQQLNKREEMAIRFLEPIIQARREASKDPDTKSPMTCCSGS
ncbi:unnamed protein product [Aspergillus oryzae]|uniref:Unnamed protein product n=1 Tax=Aspergillus oryzae TaxID=5062 RepID=A0AAN4Y7M6_ASPOZ|nr:unnamed protein product [Aspergillus oryzae]